MILVEWITVQGKAAFMGKLCYERHRRSGVALSKWMNTPQFGYILGKGAFCKTQANPSSDMSSLRRPFTRSTTVRTS